MISGLRDVSLAPNTNYFYLWRPQDTRQNPRKFEPFSKNIMFESFKILDILNVEKWQGGPDIPTTRLMTS